MKHSAPPATSPLPHVGGSDRRRRNARRLIKTLLGAIALYVIVAYLVIPFAWKNYAHRHPAFDDNPRITQTGDGHPGDPLNVALIGDETEIVYVFNAAKWTPAAALGLRSDLQIAEDTILSRPDGQAPVSSLFLFGRKEDLAFEQPVGDNPRQRHHVRFWKTNGFDTDGRPVWIGSASYDERVELSHTTGQITHHIAAEIDAERDHLFGNLEDTGDLSENYVVNGFHKTLQGRNGGDDLWITDGRLFVGVIRSNGDD